VLWCAGECVLGRGGRGWRRKGGWRELVEGVAGQGNQDTWECRRAVRRKQTIFASGGRRRLTFLIDQTCRSPHSLADSGACLFQAHHEHHTKRNGTCQSLERKQQPNSPEKRAGETRHRRHDRQSKPEVNGARRAETSQPSGTHEQPQKGLKCATQGGRTEATRQGNTGREAWPRIAWSCSPSRNSRSTG
jgi:hypothetical protein